MKNIFFILLVLLSGFCSSYSLSEHESSYYENYLIYYSENDKQLAESFRFDPLNGKRVWVRDISSFGETIESNISFQEDIGVLRVPYYSSSLTFELATTFETDTNNQFSFRLIGQENEFSPWSFSNTRTYYHLEPGTYTLLARAKNNIGDISHVQALQIRVTPPWYRSWYAGVFYFIGGITIFAFVFKVRARKTAKRRYQFQNEIKIRTEMLKEQANELRQQKEKFEKTNEIKTRLLRFAAHDLRNPITAIMGYSRILQTEEDPELRHEYAELIHDISGKMYKIVQNMLASGLRDEESFDLDLAVVDVPTVIERISKQYQIFLKQKNQSLNIEVEDDIPEVLADETRITEVLENILSNALKFSPEGSEIDIKAFRKPDLKSRKMKVNITVSDKGPGFSEADQELAFNEYQTLSAKPTSNESSTGLGLFIVKQLVAAHDGRIIIKSNEPEPGSTIGIVLPAAFVEVDETEPATA